MTYLFVFMGGVVVGCLIAFIKQRIGTGYGVFKVVPVKDEDGFYTVNVALASNQNLLNVSQVILKRDQSQQ